jgi:hypothetical protein
LLKNGQTQYFIVNTAEFGEPTGFGEHEDTDKQNEAKKQDTQSKEARKEAQENTMSQEKSWFGRLLESIFGKRETTLDSSKKDTVEKDNTKKDNAKKNSGSSSAKKTKWVKTSYGHWLSFMFVNDPHAKDGVRVMMADSLGNPNRTNDPILNGLHHMLVHGS